jgi:multiple sugar transport system permease protein
LDQGARKGQSFFLLKYGFVGPALVLLVAFNIFPLFSNIYFSFTNAEVDLFNVKGVGGENYGTVFNKPSYGQAIRTTAVFTAVVVAVELLLGFCLALCLREAFRGRDVVITLLLIPMMLCPLVVALFWKLILNSNFGLLFLTLRDGLGLGDATPLILEKMPLLAIIIVDVWMWTPFMMLIALAGLNSIPKYIYEAAEIDRASRWTVFRRITLPMCAPILLLAVLLRVTDALKQFDLVMALVGENVSETQTLSVLMYQRAIAGRQVGEGAAYGFVILVAVIALSTLFTRYIDYIQRKQGKS